MKKILIIEDNQIIRDSTASILGLANYEVSFASNGKEGVLLAKKNLPDLIICDIMMPELDGYGVFHLLSKNDKTSTIPFIFLTAKAERNEIRKGMELGADDYISKPFEDTILLKAIETRLKKSENSRKVYASDMNGVVNFLEDSKGIVELELLSKEKSISSYKKKEVVFHAGDTPHYAYFVSKGSVKSYKTHSDGKELITNILNKGDFFGHIALFEDKNYSDSAVAIDDSEILKIPKDAFLELIYRNRSVAQQFIRLLSNQVEEQEKHLLHLAYDSVRKRTAEALLQLVNKNGTLRVSREDIAGITGTATATVIRFLSEFKSENIIEINGREIKILNIEALKNI